MRKSQDRAEKDRRFYRRAHRVFAPFFRLLFRVHVTGTEHIPASGACLVCANHVGAPDAIVIAAVLSRQVRYLAKKELFSMPLVGWICRRLGACPLDRGGGDVGAIRKTLALLAEGEVVSVFPQGHRYPGKNPKDTPIRSGAGLLALHAHCPVLPIAVCMKGQRYAPFRRVTLHIGAPILPDQFEGCGEHGTEAYRHASDLIFGEICRLGGFRSDAKTEGTA